MNLKPSVRPLLSLALWATTLVLWLAVLTLALFEPANGQGLFGSIPDTPQHVIAVGGGCDGSRNCSFDGAVLEKITGATYSYTDAELVPSLVTLPTGKTSINVKTVTTTGVCQIILERNRVGVTGCAAGGAALPTANAPSFNFTTVEQMTLSWRLSKVANLTPGASNNFLAITPYFTQIAGVPNGQTFALRLHFLHSVN